VRIDPRDYQVALDRARADLAEAEASAQAARTTVPVTSTSAASQVSTSESGVGTAHARLRAARAQLEDARAREKKAEQDLARLKTLLAKDEVSRQEYDTAALAFESSRTAHEAAQAAVREAEEAVTAATAHLAEANTAPQQVGIMRARAASAEAKVVQARTTLARAQLDLDYTRVIAPASGTVSKKSIEVGQVVQRGQPLLAIVPLDDIWVTANFKESQLQKIRPGQRAEVSVDAYGGRRYQGRVESISPATGARFSLLPPENATGNYVKVVQRVPVRIVFEKGQDSEHVLRPGMSVVPTVFVK
jgi:membrane fusion protein (multidrug efflux system)